VGIVKDMVNFLGCKMGKGRATKGWNFLPGALARRDLDGLATRGICRHSLKTD
jgi:hypothetical protein